MGKCAEGSAPASATVVCQHPQDRCPRAPCVLVGAAAVAVCRLQVAFRCERQQNVPSDLASLSGEPSLPCGLSPLAPSPGRLERKLECGPFPRRTLTRPPGPCLPTRATAAGHAGCASLEHGQGSPVTNNQPGVRVAQDSGFRWSKGPRVPSRSQLSPADTPCPWLLGRRPTAPPSAPVRRAGAEACCSGHPTSGPSSCRHCLRPGAAGQGPAKSVFKPSYFVKYCSELIETGEADEVK